MPPRKSDAAKSVTGSDEVAAGTAATAASAAVAAAASAGAGSSTPAKEGASSGKDGVNIEDLNLPKSIVTRLAKSVLPPNTQIQGNAMLAMQKSATVFVNYLATHANEHAQSSNRKTVAPGDVFKALNDLELEGFKDRLEAELAKFNEIQADKRNNHRKKVAADKAVGVKGGSPADTTMVEGDSLNGEPAAKKPRTEPGRGGDIEEDETVGDVGDETEIVDEQEEEQEPEPEPEQEQEQEQEEEDEEDAEVVDDADEPPEDRDEVEARDTEDEALDNGDDSD